jgi:hypothetical protein
MLWAGVMLWSELLLSGVRDLFLWHACSRVATFFEAIVKSGESGKQASRLVLPAVRFGLGASLVRGPFLGACLWHLKLGV